MCFSQLVGKRDRLKAVCTTYKMERRRKKKEKKKKERERETEREREREMKEQSCSFQRELAWRHKASHSILCAVCNVFEPRGKPPKRERVTRGECSERIEPGKGPMLFLDRQPDAFHTGRTRQSLSEELN